MKFEHIVIGGGIIGTTIAKALEDRGEEVLLLDSASPHSGTRPSGGHFKHSWAGKMPKNVFEDSRETLDRVWGVKVEGEDKNEFCRVDIDKVLEYHRKQSFVERIDVRRNTVFTTEQTYKFDNLFVCTGFQTAFLFPELKIQNKFGVSFRVPGKIAKAVIHQWAPYKQIVAHQQSRGRIWIGDGTAIIEKNWSDKNTEACRERCLRFLKKKMNTPCQQHVGVRGYMEHNKAHPCFYQKRRNTRIIAGAAKMGTLSAGWAVNKIFKQLKMD